MPEKKFFFEKEVIDEHFGKNMATKIVVDEFDVYRKFANDLERHCKHIDCAITHNVSCEDFIIFIDYDDSPAELIKKQIALIKKAYIDRLNQSDWKIHRPKSLLAVTIKILFKLSLQLNQEKDVLF